MNDVRISGAPLTLTEGISAPSAETGKSKLYIDGNGQLKRKTGSGAVQTVAEESGDGGLAINLGGNWSILSGTYPTVTLRKLGSTIVLNGGVKRSGGNATYIGQIDSAYRPVNRQVLACSAYDGASWFTEHVEIRTDGNVYLLGGATGAIDVLLLAGIYPA